MTQAFVHTLNIGTLATWLSLAGFGAVGVTVQPWEPPAPPATAETVETEIRQEDFLLGSEPAPQGEAGQEPALEEPAPSPENLLPAPPELPSLAESQPLPDIPAIPSPEPETAKPASKPAATPRETPATPESRTASRPRQAPSTARSSSSPGRNTGTPGGSPGAQGGQGGGLSNAARLAKGRMPAPSYPAAARRAGQTGTVIVDFTVDASGTVIAANASRPSPWPLLNNEAVRTVRRWKFPPGGIMKLQRPIVFQLR